MIQSAAIFEALRWGYVNIPGVLFAYAKEMDLDMEDIGIMATILYAFETTKPLYQTGVQVGQVLQACPALSRQKLSRKLIRLSDLNLIKLENGSTSFPDKEISLDPLLSKVESLIIRDHPQLTRKLSGEKKKTEQIENLEGKIEEYRSKIEQLELQLESRAEAVPSYPVRAKNDTNMRRVADFISRKTGNLLSEKMRSELRIWLDELAFTPEFLLVMLELCFERKISNPADISKIARDLREYSISNLDGLELYFKNYVDNNRNVVFRMKKFDPDIIDFGNFTGIDMNAEARKRIYHKWRYDWGFSHAMIMKAGEIMCQRTKNGGLEYVDSVLNNWMAKEIRQVQDAEKEIAEFKSRNRGEKKKDKEKSRAKSGSPEEYEFYVPPVKS